MEKILELVNFSASADKHEIISDISFSINKGETVALLGPNGAGKSTIAAAISGNPNYKTKGQIIYGGKDISKLSADKRAKLGIFCHAKPYRDSRYFYRRDAKNCARSQRSEACPASR